jgi:predicted RNase H-like nuclease (RuvC/YqgF family)
MENIIVGVLGALGTFIGYMVGARKNHAETDKIVIENVKEILEVYSTTINDLKTEVRELRDKITEYESVIENLNHDLCEFRKEMKNGNTTTNRRKRPTKTLTRGKEKSNN